MNKIKDIINKLYKLEDLTINESKFIFNEILSGNISDIYISSFLTALKIKGESFWSHMESMTNRQLDDSD